MSEHKGMPPVSGEKIETDGIYRNDAGREELLRRGNTFPYDVVLGQTEWSLVSLPTDEQLAKIAEDERKEASGPNQQIHHGDT